jgi:small subunit ribosomal protein S17e
VRPERVKKVAKELLKRYPDKFTTEFENNKKLLGSVAKIPSIRLRNRIAGYITRLVAISKAAEKAEAEEAAEVAEEEEEEGKTK